MDRLMHTDWERIIAHEAEPCLSIYMPTYRSGEQGQQNRIRLKNLLNQAEQRLLARGLSAETAGKFLKTARALEDDKPFWHNPSDGVALFCSPRAFHAFRLPASFEELVSVGEHFTIKPLLPLFSIDSRYHVLAVSPNQVKLYSGTRFELTEVELASLPDNLTAALHFHQPEGMFQVRSGNPGARGHDKKQSAMFHGQGSAEHEKDDLQAYFRQIDHALHAYLRDQHAPLIFAGVESLYPIYRQVNSYPHLADQPIGGNPALWSRAELLERSCAVAATYWDRVEQHDAQQVRDLAASSRVSVDVEQILCAAEDGQVESLFVASDVQVWGHFDRQQRRAELLSTPGGGEDLLDLAARTVLLHRGRVYAVNVSELPVGIVASALYRYATAPAHGVATLS